MTEIFPSFLLGSKCLSGHLVTVETQEHKLPRVNSPQNCLAIQFYFHNILS